MNVADAILIPLLVTTAILVPDEDRTSPVEHEAVMLSLRANAFWSARAAVTESCGSLPHCVTEVDDDLSPLLPRFARDDPGKNVSNAHF